MNILKSTAAAALMMMAGSVAWAQDAMTGQEFAAMAAGSDMMEIQASELAIQNAQSSQVKEFAQMMVSDHTKASNELMAAAKADGVSVSAQMTDKQGATVDSLKATTGADFDSKYVQAQVMAHQEALQLMETYAANGDSPMLKAHAQKTAPIIQMHLEHVEKLANDM